MATLKVEFHSGMWLAGILDLPLPGGSRKNYFGFGREGHEAIKLALETWREEAGRIAGPGREAKNAA